MAHQNSVVADLLQGLDLGSSVAEFDSLLEVARVETSAFTDLWLDRADLVPGTKGSGKSALFRIFVDFLPGMLLEQRKVVVAHGVQALGDPVFHAFSEQFDKLTEQEFVSFWCIYLVSLANEHFIKAPRYADFLSGANVEIGRFRSACVAARIPEITAPKSLRGILEWALNAILSLRPKVKYTPPGDAGSLEIDLFGTMVPRPEPRASNNGHTLPKYVDEIKQTLDAVLEKSQLALWLMVDRLDEIFPRRSDIEQKALRGLLRAMGFFASGRIRVKVFLRDDMLDHVVRTPDGFTALTHVTARKSDTLRWTEEQILTMLVKRIFANRELSEHLKVDQNRIDASAEYREECFYRVFPAKVDKGTRKSPTIRWIFKRCADGRSVVTPRDVLDLVIRAKQRQQDTCANNPDGICERIIDSAAIRYGFEELSKQKRQTYLEAEFPHLWTHIEKFIGKKTEFSEGALKHILGSKWREIANDLVAIGFLSQMSKTGQAIYSIPFLYRHALNLTQGKA